MKLKILTVLIVCFLFFGCASSIIELKYPCPPAYSPGNYKLYIGDFTDARPSEETKFSFSDNIKFDNAFIPLPDFAFDPSPPAEFVKNTVKKQLCGVFTIVNNPDSADFCISGTLTHFSIFRTPSNAVKLSQRVTLCSGIAAELCVFVLTFIHSDQVGTGAVICMAPMFIFGLPASRSTIKYDSQISVNLEIKEAGAEDVLLSKEIIYENSYTLPAKKSIDNRTESNILIKNVIDGICSYLVETIK
ncbi:MAG: hypothetical protein PHX21_11850 [bacterium]|nr:hypothetical protein [bacterium]